MIVPYIKLDLQNSSEEASRRILNHVSSSTVYCSAQIFYNVLVCPAGFYGPKCLNQCHCYNNSRCSYLTGECNSTCKAGWTGNSCNSRG